MTPLYAGTGVLRSRMKTLILCVDRDDDLGEKGRVATPIIGRRRNVEAAMALGLADPEDSDTNALFAAVHLYDQELPNLKGQDQVEVATVAGHKKLGLQADRKLAAELQEVLDAVRPDEVILVSDGAEDEQILPLLASRAKVAHVHRSIVKQAPRLEGFYYVITRLLDDEKQAKRFVLPFAIVLLVWGIAYLAGVQAYAWGATLAIMGLWLLIHAMKWEERVGALFHDVGEGIRAGKLSLLANLVMLLLIAAGVIVGFVVERGHGQPKNVAFNWPTLYHALIFVQAFLPYMVSAFLVRAAGSLFDSWVRGGDTSTGAWSAACVLVFLGLSGSVVLDMAVDVLEARDLIHIVTPARALQVTAGIVILMGGLMVGRYLRAPQPRPQR
ncbi:MAG: putative rane protein [Thermoplasmata archaeon]|jgi:putative membrane protein|nr:putative rane protein [Thermoplasmata archaeon]